MTSLAHILLCGNSALLGGMNIPQSNAGYEPNSELNMAGWFVPTVNCTNDDDGTCSHMSDIPLQLPERATVAFFNSALVTFSEAEDDLIRNVPSLHPIPSQTDESVATTPRLLPLHSSDTFHAHTHTLLHPPLPSARRGRRT